MAGSLTFWGNTRMDSSSDKGNRTFFFGENSRDHYTVLGTEKSFNWDSSEKDDEERVNDHIPNSSQHVKQDRQRWLTWNPLTGE